MSDTQLVTGFSTLISGFVQLRQGLQAYHWLAIVDLAWFSVITHLAYLTFLRSHFEKHSLERTIRVTAMACLAIMLIVALSFTSSYDWALTYGDDHYIQPNSSDDLTTIYHPAICHMGMRPYNILLGLNEDPHDLEPGIGWFSMIISIMLIVLGFAFRAMKMYKMLYTDTIQSVRSRISIYVRGLLRAVYLWCCPGKHILGLRRGLLYRPLLAVFLLTRLLIDIGSSMLLEVGFLNALVSFSRY